MHRISAALFLIACLVIAASAMAQQSDLIMPQKPTLSRTSIAFMMAGEIWSVAREGGQARLLTSGPGTKSDPVFSPDGKWIAYTGEQDGNADVYLIPGEGGMAKRLTYHPGVDEVVGWTPDSKRVLFRSARNSYTRFNRLFTVGLDGGLPQELPLPMAEEGAYSPDGARIAYVPVNNFRRQWSIAWKNYRGGRTARVWLANLGDLSVTYVPREDSNDYNPMWIGNTVYFLSDRNGAVGLFSYEPGKKVVKKVVATTSDIKSAAAASDVIVYEQFGSLHLFDIASGKEHAVPVRLSSDLPRAHERFIKAAEEIGSSSLSPSGVRALFEAHCDVFTAPREKGDVRNLTNTPETCERDPAWSPDGKQLAYFSDASGEYELHLRAADGMGEVVKISLGAQPSFFYQPVWSPDGNKIAYTDKRLNLWYIDLAKKVPVKVDTDTYDHPERSLDPVWSPDSKWIAYTKRLPSFMHAVFFYSLDQGKAFQATDGLSDARHPAFDKNGKYLYFLASTDIGPTLGWLDLSSSGRRVTRTPYLLVLSKDDASPLTPENDDEKAADAEKPEDAKDSKPKSVVVRIDAANIDQRILSLPMPAREYLDLKAGKEGTIFVTELAGPANAGAPQTAVSRFDLKSRKPERIIDAAANFSVSFDGKRLLYSRTSGSTLSWYIEDAAKSATANGKPESALDLSRMEAAVDPRAEWRQIYEEVWRVERDFFYDPGLHGVDLKATRAQFRPYLENVGSRADLNYLMAEMLGELSVGHLYLRMPNEPAGFRVRTGLLGADYKIENGRYRFWKIYSGENWNPELRAPLTQPGVNVQEGDYLLAVNGRELKGSDEVFELFQGTADKSVVLRVGADPTGKDARTVTVVPIESETSLRNRAWIDTNRRRVDQLSGGRLAYVYLPDTANGGFTHFNRYYFAQRDKQGAVIDERFNGGGAAADYVIDYLRRPAMSYWATREGSNFTTPVGAIFGPKAMIINMYAGSGGDAMPWYFRQAKLGPLVGTRTWGGLVGIYDYPRLMDGSQVTAPRVAFYSPTGEWDVENHGVAPDIEVEMTPQAWISGHDPQLERAVQAVLEQLEKNPPQLVKKPAFPNYHGGKSTATGAQ